MKTEMGSAHDKQNKKKTCKDDLQEWYPEREKVSTKTE